MKKKQSLLLTIPLFILCLNAVIVHHVEAVLGTNSRWIVGENGKRVKLGCVNWPSHLETMFAEGLSKQPLDVISKKIGSMGFNCVRLTWPTYLPTKFASLTVRQSFENAGLGEFLSGIQYNNPSLLHLPLLQAFQAVISNLGKNNLMVILDNHNSKPGWCCDKADGNGFFGDQDFDPNIWINGLTQMATTFKGTPNVVAMSLRNELRGSRENVNDWYRYMQEGAEAVHAANPNVLVILSGLDYDADLSFLRNKPVQLTFTGKLAFEVHWYGFFDNWRNNICGRVTNNLKAKAGFLLEQGWPLILSEFGLDLKNPNPEEGRYLDCFLGVAKDLDFDWALWGLQGSYYLRQGGKDVEESYGVLSFNWSEIRNPDFIQRLDSIRAPSRGMIQISESSTLFNLYLKVLESLHIHSARRRPS